MLSVALAMVVGASLFHAIAGGPRGSVRRPFAVLLRSHVHGPQRGGGPAARRCRFTVVSETVSGTRARTPRLLRRR
jgi:hypothetical protein